MRRVLIAVVVVACAVLAHAVNLQLGFSGYDNRIAELIKKGTCLSHTTAWTDNTNGLSGVNGGYRFSGVDFREHYETTTVGGQTGATLLWENRNNTSVVRLAQIDSIGYYHEFTINGETHNCPAFGYVWAGYIDDRIFNGVFTIHGDPYSVVVNDTSEDREVNGVTIGAGKGVRLKFPFFLRMAEVSGLAFYDLKTGEQFTCDYRNGAYQTMWTGDFRFTDNTRWHPPTNQNTLVYADIKGGEEKGKILYGKNGEPVYRGIVHYSTNITLYTWWDFSSQDWGDGPQAYINDECVCSGHSTTHIVDYTVYTGDLEISTTTGEGSVTFTMWQIPESGYSGGPCIMRCWETAAGGGTEGYGKASADHKGEISAGTGVATFKIVVNIYQNTWKIVTQ